MAPVFTRVLDLTSPGDASRFLEPEGLAAHAGALPCPCRAAWLPRAAWDAGLAAPPRVTVLAGLRGVVLCGTSEALGEAARALPPPVGPSLARALRCYEHPASRLVFADGEAWDLGERPRIMGIVNVTPDSFSDGGRFVDPGTAVAHGARLLDEGADLLDLGAESTRPGAAPVGLDEELSRLLPVLETLRSAHPRARLSVDTRHARVARAALEAGADLVNDVSALGDPAMAPLVAAAGVPVVLMHMRGTPGTMQSDTCYDDLLAEVGGFLQDRAERAREAGIPGDRILLDPGLGFGKSADGNLLLLGQLRSLAGLGYPLLVGASRKAFLGHLTGIREPAARIAGSVAAAVAAVAHGAGIVRVHDVAPTREALAVARAISASW